MYVVDRNLRNYLRFTGGVLMMIMLAIAIAVPVTFFLIAAVAVIEERSTQKRIAKYKRQWRLDDAIMHRDRREVKQ